jgi:hypothetical protein
MGAAVQWDDRIGRRLKLRDLHIFMAVAQQQRRAQSLYCAIHSPCRPTSIRLAFETAQ